MDDQHVVGVEVAAVSLVALLRKECGRVAERRRVGAIEHRRERVDVRFEDVEPFEHARGALGKMLLQHPPVDERDLAPLHDLVEPRVCEIDRLARLEQIQEIHVEQRIVEVPAQVLEREELLAGRRVRRGGRA